ncbi:hypothetical protein E2562_022081 [Oryza meyeriana var. granulata]|uniref:Uncharacterized protein n=1 Tax=Oryza meyeriana var. granulata TaxID=110450 RepID=A0A6G1ENP6_9ORYZ|nr:hypothetical protein E2562_022081 [Oryza meyeriana var. granulata]
MDSEVEFGGYEEAGGSMDREEEACVMEIDPTNGATELSVAVIEPTEAVTDLGQAPAHVFDWDAIQIEEMRDDEGRLEIASEEQLYVLLGLRDEDEMTERATEGIVRVRKTVLGAYMHVLSILKFGGGEHMFPAARAYKRAVFDQHMSNVVSNPDVFH